MPQKLNSYFNFETNNKQYLLVNEKSCLSHLFEFNSRQFIPVKSGIVTGKLEQVVPVYRDDSFHLVSRGAEEGCLVAGINIWSFKNNIMEVSEHNASIYRGESECTIF